MTIALGRAPVHVLQEDVEDHREEDEDRRLEQVGHDADADESGVGDHVRGRRRSVARDVGLWVHIADGEAAEFADHEIEKPCDLREAPW